MYTLAFVTLLNSEGRINRRQYLFMATLCVLTMMFLGAIAAAADAGGVIGLFSLIIALLMIPTQVKRLHDMDMSGWLVLIGLIPFLNSILGLCLLLIPGTEKENQYGIPPHLQKLDKAD